MKRVLVLANNLSQASFRLRVAALVPLLARRGFDLQVRLRPKGALAAPKMWRLLRSAGQWDAVLVQRKLLDPWEANLLKRVARKIYYDVDDAVMQHNRQVGRLSRWRTQRRFLATARVLDHVVAGNDYLAGVFVQQGCRATVIPTVLDCEQYQVRQHAPTQSPRLVWIGSRSTLGYVQQFLPALEAAARQAPGLRLLTIADETVSSAVLPIEHEPWSPQTEAAALCRGDIGIAPMPLDPWTIGKCGFKILQYMAAGLPVVASPVGANAQIVQQGITGLLPARSDDWPAAIAQLAGDVALRERMGRRGRDLAAERYSLARAADDWARLLDE